MTEPVLLQEQKIDNNLDLIVSKVLEEDYETLIDFLTEDMNPIDIDIIELSTRFKNILREMKENNLLIPAKVILTCAVILKIKTDALFSINDSTIQESVIEDSFFEEINTEILEEDSTDIHIPQLTLPIRRMPKKRVTLSDLKNALEKAMILQVNRDERLRNKKEYSLKISEEDIEKKIESLFYFVRKKIGKTRQLTFKELLQNKDIREKIEKFLHVLCLEGDRKVDCLQEEFLGEIIVKLLGEKKQKEVKVN